MKKSKMRYATTIILSLISTLLISAGVLALSGGLDPTFDQDGLVTTSFGLFTDEANDVAIQPDGKIVVVGKITSKTQTDARINFGIARYNTNGALDKSFSADGKVVTNFTHLDYATSIVIQSDGKIVVGGNTTSDWEDYQFALARYNSDGSLDNTFDTDGQVTTDLGNNMDNITDMALQNDGKIIAVGSKNTGINSNDIAIVRYNPDGSLDSTFDGDGIVTTAMNNTFIGYVAIDKDDQILVGGVSNLDLILLRYNNDGSLDTTFGTNGIVLTDYENKRDAGGAIAILPNGKILIAGAYETGTSIFFTITGYNNNGILDTSFGTNGKVAHKMNSQSAQLRSLAIQSNGKIILAGNQSFTESKTDFILTRYLSNGTIDKSFGTAGKTTTDFGNNQNNFVAGITIAANGNIVLVGNMYIPDNNSQTNQEFALARYIGDPLLSSNSTATQDGRILESSETSDQGGAMNSGAATFLVGDDANNQQYRGILSFNTASLPDTAVITHVMLKIKKQDVVGSGNPVTIFQGFMADIINGTFGTAALQSSDFQTAASKSYGPFKPALVGSWYNINLTSGKTYINKLATAGGLTQIRLRFKLDDNNDAVANYLSLYSGNAPAADRPQLVITYTMP